MALASMIMEFAAASFNQRENCAIGSGFIVLSVIPTSPYERRIADIASRLISGLSAIGVSNVTLPALASLPCLIWPSGVLSGEYGA